MILHLVRHPKPVVPAQTCYGRLDVAAEGVAAAAARLRPLLPPAAPVWTSPLRRCRDLAMCLHPQPVVDERLAEMDFGHWEGKTWDEIGASPLDAWAADVAGFTPPGGESAAALQARALDWVARLPVAEAVVVTHAGVQRVLLAHWLGVPPEDWTTLTFAYGAVTTVELEETGAVLRRLNK